MFSALAAMSLTSCQDSRTFETTSTPAEQTLEFNANDAWEEFEGQFRLFYAYIDRYDFDVDEVLNRTKNLALKSSDKAEFRRILHRMTFAFTDPHFIIGPFEDEDFNIIPTSSDIRIALQNGSYIVTDVRAGSAADKAGVRPGWILAAVNGTDIDEAVLSPFVDIVSNPTEKQLSYAATLLANGQRKYDRKLTFKHDGGDEVISLPSPRDFAIALNEQAIVSVRRESNIGIIRINNSLGNNDLITEFDKAIKEVSNVDGLVIDMRNTASGGNTEVGRSILGHFVSKSRPYQVHEIPSLEREYTVPRHFVEYVKPRQPYFDPDKTVVLGSFWTGSMGEGLVIGFDAIGVHTIASDMGDLLGELSNFDLEISGARMDIGTETLFHINGQPREDYVADLPLASADRAADGSDPAMKAALEYLQAE